MKIFNKVDLKQIVDLINFSLKSFRILVLETLYLKYNYN